MLQTPYGNMSDDEKNHLYVELVIKSTVSETFD
jgi:hypothetical protein